LIRKKAVWRNSGNPHVFWGTLERVSEV
jgi:hypothetical protein